MSDPIAHPGVLVGIKTDEIKDLKIWVPTTGSNMELKKISEIQAALCENHIDLGKTLGIRRVKIEFQITKVEWDDIYLIHHPDQTVCTVYGPDSGWITFNSLIDSVQSNTGDPVGFGFPVENIVRTPTSVTHTFPHNKFLLVNLGFKSNLSKPNLSGLTDWGGWIKTIEYPVSALVKDSEDDNQKYICLIAGKDFPPKRSPTHWAPVSDDDDDVKDQIVASACHMRPFLFFLSDAEPIPNGDPGGYIAGGFELHPYYRPNRRYFDTVKDVLDEREFDASWGGALAAKLTFASYFLPAKILNGIPIPQILLFRPDYKTWNADFVIRSYAGDIDTALAAMRADDTFEKWDIGGLAFIDVPFNPGYYTLSAVNEDGTGVFTVWSISGSIFTVMTPRYSSINHTIGTDPPTPGNPDDYVVNPCIDYDPGPYPGFNEDDYIIRVDPTESFEFVLGGGTPGGANGVRSYGGLDYDLYSERRESHCMQRAGLQLLTTDTDDP